MDPNETLKMIHDFVTDKHTGTQVDIWCEHLWQWIETRNGFEPDWDKYPLGMEYYNCRKVSMDKPDYEPVKINAW